jgi:hypothetical protein
VERGSRGMGGGMGEGVPCCSRHDRAWGWEGGIREAYGGASGGMDSYGAYGFEFGALVRFFYGTYHRQVRC